MRRDDNKGFTLAELLIVVAIIGVLVAISIPIFSKQLEKARDATTLANLRNVYAEVQTEYISQAGSTQRKNYWVNGGHHIFVTYKSGGGGNYRCVCTDREQERCKIDEKFYCE
jgi:prepilin-type N-terminal cleavage/methylation domain-containing protein